MINLRPVGLLLGGEEVMMLGSEERGVFLSDIMGWTGGGDGGCDTESISPDDYWGV